MCSCGQRDIPLCQSIHASSLTDHCALCWAWKDDFQEEAAGADMGPEPHQAAPLGHVVKDGLSRSDVVINAGLPCQWPLAPHHTHPAQAQPGGPCLNLHPPAGQTIIRPALGGPCADGIPSTTAQADPRPGFIKEALPDTDCSRLPARSVVRVIAALQRLKTLSGVVQVALYCSKRLGW